MIDCAYSEIGQSLGLPTQAYIALSDAKALDAQAGLETGIGAVLAALSGINSVSGPGMLDFESCQSLEKLVVDDEICGMARGSSGASSRATTFPPARSSRSCCARSTCSSPSTRAGTCATRSRSRDR